jgi:uncharacterized protein (DUF302 family)
MSTSRIVVDHIRLTAAKPFDRARAEFERQLGKFDADAYKSLAAGDNAETARSRIEAMAGSSGFMLFATHDHGSLLKIVGQPRKALQYIIGNPLIAVQMTQYAIGSSLYAPLRVLLYENDKGETCLDYDLPSSLFGQFADERIARVASSLDDKLEALATTTLR